MESAIVRHLGVQRSLAHTQYETEFEPEYGILWGFLKPEGLPLVTLKVLEDVRKHDRVFESSGGRVIWDDKPHQVNYYVNGSRANGVYSLGGDLAYFMQCIEQRDRDALMDYATRCIDNVWPRTQNYYIPDLITISLVQGDALGGGFEGALASDVIIAEEQAKMGLPEILFNMFPGMGAYSLLTRRVGPRLAEEMILSGNLYPAAKLQEMGIVDKVVPKGQGELAVYDYIEKVHKRRNGIAATYRARRSVFPLTHEELLKITTDWVDTAFRLEAKDLRIMARIVRSQECLKPNPAAAAPAPRQAALA